MQQAQMSQWQSNWSQSMNKADKESAIKYIHIVVVISNITSPSLMSMLKQKQKKKVEI